MIPVPNTSPDIGDIATSPADLTRTALIRAALKLFGRQGFNGTSTREIAALANANIGSIAYHFGGKSGLRAAVADYIVETVETIAGQAIGDVQALKTEIRDPNAARDQLFSAIERMVAFLVARPEAGDIVQFMLRETSQPTEALDRIYEGVFEPTHRKLCQIWEQATGEPAESEATRLTMFTMIGQIIYFRIGREIVMRGMGWDAIGDSEASKILNVVRDNFSAILANRKDV